MYWSIDFFKFAYCLTRLDWHYGDDDDEQRSQYLLAVVVQVTLLKTPLPLDAVLTDQRANGKYCSLKVAMHMMLRSEHDSI